MFDAEDDGAVIGVVIVKEVGVLFPFLGREGNKILIGDCFTIVHL